MYRTICVHFMHYFSLVASQLHFCQVLTLASSSTRKLLHERRVFVILWSGRLSLIGASCMTTKDYYKLNVTVPERRVRGLNPSARIFEMLRSLKSSLKVLAFINQTSQNMNDMCLAAGFPGRRSCPSRKCCVGTRWPHAAYDLWISGAYSYSGNNTTKKNWNG